MVLFPMSRVLRGLLPAVHLVRIHSQECALSQLAPVKSQITGFKYQTICNDQNSKLQTIGLVHWDLRFICYLVLVI
jgi:hypothetical protein